MTLLEKVQADLLTEAERLTTIPEEKMKQALVNNIRGFWMLKLDHGQDRIYHLMARNTAGKMYILCSELRRRRTGKHVYELTALIRKQHDVEHFVKLGDIAPDMVEP